MIKRQGSPPHPLSGYIQAQISQQVQNLQTPAHVSFPQQSAKTYPAPQERYAGYQHGQGQGQVMTNSQVKYMYLHVLVTLIISR